MLIGHDPEGTVGSFRNDLARQARGEWLCFLDADDELAPGYLEAMRRAFRISRENGDGSPLLFTPAVAHVRQGRMQPARFYPEVNLLNANYLVVGTLIERSLFERVGGFGDFPHGFEDWALWYKCARLGAKVVPVRRAIYIEHINRDSIHRAAWRDRRTQVQMHMRVARELEAWTP